MEIADLKKFDTGACKARFSVKLENGIEIRECGLFDTNGQKWIALPSRPYEKDGVKKYFQIVNMIPEVKKKFDQKVFEKLAPFFADEYRPKSKSKDEELPF